MREAKLTAFLMAGLLLVPAAAQQPAYDSLLEGEIFTLDRAHALMDFTVRQLGFARIRGTFNKYEAAVYYVEEDITQSSVTVVVDVNSLDTGNKQRDDHLRSKDFFHVEEFPRLTFHSERVVKSADGFVAIGPLTIHGVTREARIPFHVVSRKAADQWSNQRIVFTGALTLNRRDFGVNGPDFWNKLISETVEIDIDLAASIFNYNNPFSRWRENSIGKLIVESVEQEGLGAANAKVRKLWDEKKEDYDFSMGQIFRAGMQLQQRGKLPEAIGILELALDLHRDSAAPENRAALHAIIGETQARTGQRRSALRSVEQALALNPHDVRALELRRQLGN